MFGELAVAVLDHHDCRIYEDSDGQSKSAERHDVRADVEVVHRDERRNDGDWQCEDRDQRRAKVKQEENDDDADDDGFFEQIALQCFNGRVNQTGTVVTGDHFDSGRQRGFGLRQFFLYAIDDGESIHAVAHHDNACYGFPFALPLGDTFTDVGPKLTVPRSRTRTGVPFFVATGTASRSFSERR